MSKLKQSQMHASSLERMNWFRDTYIKEDVQTKVLDVGSYDVNGSYRQFFKDSCIDYTGLDMSEGPNVDTVFPACYAKTTVKKCQINLITQLSLSL